MAFLVLYVDDILLIGNNVGMLSIVKVWLANTFDMKDLGELSYILGIKLFRDRKRRIMGLSQVTYIEKVLSRFSIDNSKKGLLPFRHGRSPRISVLKHKRREIVCQECRMLRLWVVLCMRCSTLD